MSYKGVVFFDYDGTLADEREGIYHPTEKSKESIIKLKENGYAAFLCTGRAKCYMAETGIDFDGYVTSNGAYAEIDGKIILDLCIEPHLLKKLISAMDELNMFYSVERQDRCVLKDIENVAFRKMMDNFNISYDNFYPIDKDYDFIGNKLLVAYDKEEQFEELKERFKGIFHITKHRFSKSGDIGRTGITKATGIKAAIDYLGIDIADTYAFGDAANDYEMLETVGHGIAMGVHSSELEKVCEYVTDTVRDEGVTKALVEYGLIEE